MNEYTESVPTDVVAAVWQGNKGVQKDDVLWAAPLVLTSTPVDSSLTL